jgi:hypothetical protein
MFSPPVATAQAQASTDNAATMLRQNPTVQPRGSAFGSRPADRLRQPIGNQARLRLLARRMPSATTLPSTPVVQLASDPSPPPNLELDKTAEPAQGTDPIFDEGSAAPGSESLPKQEEAAKPVQTAGDGSGNLSNSPGVAGRVAGSLGSGVPLAPDVRGSVRDFFGHDLGAVRIHADSRADSVARSLHAQAFTVGEQIGFAAGRYDPQQPAGQRLLVHELTHVVQQRSGLDSAIRRAGIGAPGDQYEREAERNAERFVRGERAEGGNNAAAPSSAGAAVQLYSGSAAAAYARKWALGTNPDYPRDGNDCTNFVSQSVYAGGWVMAGGSCDDRKSDSAWWYGDSNCWYPGVHRSYTWGGAQNFFNFVGASSRGSTAANISDLDIGDVLQVAHKGHVGHSTIVTGKAGANLLVSYHTNDNLDLPVWGPGGFLERESNPDNTFFAWKL